MEVQSVYLAYTQVRAWPGKRPGSHASQERRALRQTLSRRARLEGKAKKGNLTLKRSELAHLQWVLSSKGPC